MSGTFEMVGLVALAVLALGVLFLVSKSHSS
jgi:hypothetical protein